MVADSKLAAYVVAKDFALPANGLVTNNATTTPGTTDIRTRFVFENKTNPNNISANTDYVVTLTLTGPAKFKDQSNSVVVLGTVTDTTETPILSGDGKTLTIFVKTGGTVTAGQTLERIAVSGFNIEVSAQESVSVSYKLQQVVGSQTLDLDSSSAAEVISFKNALALHTGTTRSVLAALPNFLSFKDVSGALTSNNFTAKATTTYNTDLTGTNVPAVTSIITGYSATVTGPQVKDMLTSFDGIAIASATDVTATSATFAVTSGTDAEAVGLVLTPKANTPIQEGSYKVTIRPTYATSWSGPASVERTVVSVGLDGTNFYAPWFALNNGTANSTLRLANNSGTATGAVVVQLKARNVDSTAANTQVVIRPNIPANGFVSITGAELREAFGTDAANGDLLVSIQSQAANVVSAKVRTTQSTGQIYENSLELLQGAGLADLKSSVDSITTTVNAIKAKTDLITTP